MFVFSGTSQEKCEPAALLLGSPGSTESSTAIVLGNKSGLRPARHYSADTAGGETSEISNLPHSDSTSSDKLFVL